MGEERNGKNLTQRAQRTQSGTEKTERGKKITQHSRLRIKRRRGAEVRREEQVLDFTGGD
jgi:hypothetical protein